MTHLSVKAVGSLGRVVSYYIWIACRVCDHMSTIISCTSTVLYTMYAIRMRDQESHLSLSSDCLQYPHLTVHTH